MSLETTPRAKRLGTIAEAVAYSALSRSRLYELAHVEPRLFKKNGRRSLVDYHILDRLLDAPPTADLKASDDN
jgi:hypothetical protein